MILPLEKQLPTRETCERLQDAGFEAETLYVWQGPPTHKTWGLHQNGLLRAPSYYESILPAPTAAELGALLSAAWLNGGEEIVDLIPDEMSNAWMGSENEAEARALLWLDLHAKDLLPSAAYGASSH